MTLYEFTGCHVSVVARADTFTVRQTREWVYYVLCVSVLGY